MSDPEFAWPDLCSIRVILGGFLHAVGYPVRHFGAAYRFSVQAGSPLSERKLAQMFGCTSRRWARARIAEAQQVLSPGLAEDQVSVMSP
jgi:hypothetical protein